jgi:alpha-D-ribose 1-methylphosphonate 5-triphosphate synthase subunit PhnH
MSRTHALPSGFADPSADSQAVFRAVLRSMSRPGTIVSCPVGCDAPAPLSSSAAAVAACLLDRDTITWLDRAFDRELIRTFLRFHTGVSFCGTANEASFALIGEPDQMPQLNCFALGSARDPERSTTLVVQLPSLRDGEPIVVAGPGIQDTATIRPVGLPGWFFDAWSENHRQFPRGIDLIMTDGAHLLSVPRTAGLR